MIGYKGKEKRYDRGQSAVEFALILPVFTILLFGIIEFGRLWMTVNIMSGAAREGARVAVISGSNFTQARTSALNVLNAGNVNNATVTITGPNGNNEVQVTVTLQYRTFTGNLVPGLAPVLNLSQSASMRWEG